MADRRLRQSMSTRSAGSAGSAGSRRRSGLWSSPGRSYASTRTSHRSISSDRLEERFEVDRVFVQFLIDYAANNPECPPLFKAYLEEEVLVARNGEDPVLKVEYHLRNPDIKQFGLGHNFVTELENYTIHEQVFPDSNNNAVMSLPSAPIPEKYLPQTQAEATRQASRQVSGGIDIDALTELMLGGVDEAVAGEQERKDEHGEVEEVVREDGERLGDVPGRAGTRPKTSRPHIRHRPERGPISTPALVNINRVLDAMAPGRLADLYQQLHHLGTMPTADLFPDREEWVDRTGPDWDLDSWYKGKRQPPLGARLETIVNFLADEDVDRCMDWETKFSEVVAYLSWLSKDDDKQQLSKASPQTWAMFNDAVRKAKAHLLFEDHHYRATPLEITRPSKHPLRSTRLNWMINSHDWPRPSYNPIPDKTDLLPRAIPPRPVGPVNGIPIDDEIYNTFIEHEKAWWQRVANSSGPIPSEPSVSEQQDNLFVLESAAFSTFSSPSSTGWTHPDPSNPSQPLLPDNTPSLPTTSPTNFARTRAAHRAGLLQALHALASLSPSHTTLPPTRPISFPLPASTLLTTISTTDAPQWTPPALPPDHLPPQQDLEPYPTLIAYRAQENHLRKMRELARLRVEDEYARDRRWVTLPKNVVVGAPFVWRGIDPDMQGEQELLKKCRGVVEVLRAAERKVPTREVVRDVLGVVERVVGGGGFPERVRLAEEEWAAVKSATELREVPRVVDGEDVRWLRFLAGGCVNRESWKGVEEGLEGGKRKYKLFRIFAARVQRLLDDGDPDGLFARHDARVTVEELLEAINAGAGSSAVTKCVFQPHDACCWLDRMKASGHVSFRLDPACYGVVGRPVAEYFPEHRVVWPTPAEGSQRPRFFCHIRDWDDTIQDVSSTAAIARGSKVWNFFVSLGLRLGYTISILQKSAAAAAAANPQPVPSQYLRDSLSKWQAECVALDPDAKPARTPAALSTLRTAIIDELSTNKTMLAPGREHHYLDPATGTHQTVLVRDHNWDWAKPTLKPPHQFWSLNRWPLHTGHLRPETEQTILADAHTDPAQTYDPTVLDPTTDRRYLRPKLRPYREERVKFRPGPAFYPVGDTRLQREAVEGYMTEMVHRAVGLDPHKRGWLERLNPFSQGENRSEEGKLPAVSRRAMPKSWDPQGEQDRMEAARRGWDEMDVEDEDELEEGGIGSGEVDVAMAGMSESWVGA